MAVSVYDRTFLSKGQQEQLQRITEEWERANAAGDKNAMASAHAAAESVRAQANYSGGGDGSEYSPIDQRESYTPSRLPTYQAQTQVVEDAYDAARELQLAQLKTAYDANMAALEASRGSIPQVYAAGRNATAAAARRENQAFNEYAAASGLNTGAGGQVRLAQSNQLQSDLSALSRAESDAQREAQLAIDQLRVAYQNDVAAAMAQGEYQKAAALLDEYRAQEQSIVNTAAAQADENYRGYSVNYQRQLQQAQTLASFGDFSGYAALGYSPEEISRLNQAWTMKNPQLAYNMGMISYEEYLRAMGMV